MGNNSLSQLPLIDKRMATDVAERLRLLIRDFTGIYGDESDVAEDPQANTFVGLYSNMMQILLERLNRVPERNYIAFLNMLGINPEAPQASRTSITFDLGRKSPSRTALIPARTQVAVQKSSDGNPLIFETENDQMIIRPDFLSMINIDGIEDRYFEMPKFFFDKNVSLPITLFKTNNPIKHQLYLGDTQALGQGFDLDLIIKVELAETKLGYTLEEGSRVKWYGIFEDVEDPMELRVEATNQNFQKLQAGSLDYDSDIANLLKSGYIRFETIDRPVREMKLEGYEKITRTDEQIENDEGHGVINEIRSSSWTNFWLLAELDGAISSLHIEYPSDYQEAKELKFPLIENLTLISTPQVSFEAIPPDTVHYNGLLLDISKPFYPAGERPVINDAIYIGCRDVFSHHGNRILLTFTRSSLVDRMTDSVDTELTWEYYDGKEWLLLGKSSTQGTLAGDEMNNRWNFEDETTAFSFRFLEPDDDDGIVSFKCPQIKPFVFRGKKNYYIRIRITKGNYSTPDNIYYPPMVEEFSLDFEGLAVEKAPRDILTYNNFFYKDAVQKKRELWLNDTPYEENSAISNADNSATNLSEEEKTDKSRLTPFSPFEQFFKTEKTLYIGFDENISDLPVGMFFALANQDDEALELIAYKEQSGVIMEYWNGEDWQPVHIHDETDNLTKQGRIFFNSPEDMKNRILFNREACWIRLRYKKGSPLYYPKADGIYLNPIPAHQAVSVYNEVLGSSTGLKNQVFSFTNTPVLPGQQIYVKEKNLTKEDRELLIDELGNDAVIETYNSVDKITEYWVCWTEVSHFMASTPASRHYKIDRKTNQILFGNGAKGSVPATGRSNIKAVYYQYGGGERGNVSKGNINQLKTTIPFVSSAFNVISAYGGRDIQTLEDIKRLGGDVIQFQKRMITVSDFSSIANYYFKEIARIETLPNTDILANYRPGYITLMVLAKSMEAKPAIKLRLIQELYGYISRLSLNYLTNWRNARINIITPRFVKIDVNAKVTITTEANKEGKLNFVESEAVKRLTAFFHPVYGGQKKKGWNLGEGVPVSEIISEIEQTEDVEGVEEIEIIPSLQLFTLYPFSTTNPLSPFPAQSILKVGKYQQYLVATDINNIDEETGLPVPLSGMNELDNHREITGDDSLPDNWNPVCATGFKEEDEITIQYRESPDGEIDVRDQLHLKISSVKKNLLTFEPADVHRTFPVGSVITTRDGNVRSYITREIAEHSNGSLAFDTPLEVEVAIPDKERIYNFGDEFNDDMYEDKWNKWFRPEDFQFIPFSKPFEFTKESFGKDSNYKMISLESDLLLMIYKPVGTDNNPRIMFGEIDKQSGSIRFTGNRGIPLGKGRRVYRWIPYWVRLRRRYRVRRRCGCYFWRWGYYWSRRWRRYYYYLPMNVGEFTIAKITDTKIQNGGRFAIFFNNKSDQYRAYSIIANYYKSGTDNTTYSVQFYTKYNFAVSASDIQALPLGEGDCALVYKASEDNYRLAFCRLAYYHYYSGSSYYYYGYRLLSRKSNNLLSPSVTGISDLQIIDLKNNAFAIGFRGYANYNDAAGTYGYLAFADWNALVGSTTLDNLSVTSLHPLVVKGTLGIVEFKIELVYTGNDTERSYAYVFTRQSEDGGHEGRVWYLDAAPELTITNNTDLEEPRNSQIGIFTTRTSNIKNLMVGGYSWKKNGRPVFVIGYIDGQDLNRIYMVRCEIEIDTDSASNQDYRLDFNTPVLVSDETAADLSIQPFPRINQTDDNEIVYFGVYYRHKSRSRAVLANELGLFGRPGPSEMERLSERYGVLTMDTGVAFENTPKRFYVVSSQLGFEWQYFELSMTATIGEFLENNWGLFVSVTDKPISPNFKNAPPLSGLQLCVIRKMEDENKSTEPDAHPPSSTGTGTGGDTETDPDDAMVNDESVVEKILLYGNSGSDKIEEIIPDGTLVSNLQLLFKLRYYEKTTGIDPVTGIESKQQWVTGKVTGRSEGTTVFETELNLSKDSDKGSFLNKTSLYHLSIGIANLIDTDPADPFADDVDVRSRGSVEIEQLSTNLKIRPFRYYGENKFTLINRDDSTVHQEFEKGSGDFRIGTNGISHIYMHKHNLVYSGTHQVIAFEPTESEL